MTGREWIVGAEGAGLRLDRWLAAPERLGSRTRARDALARGRVFVDGREEEAAAGGRVLTGCERVRLWMDRPGSAARRRPHAVRGLAVVYEDEVLAVVNKPAGLLTEPHPDDRTLPSVAGLLCEAWRGARRRPLMVHRIDRDTSGLVVFAKRTDSWRNLKAQFARREPLRRYVAVIEGHVQPRQGTWRDRLAWDAAARRQRAAGGPSRTALEAITQYATHRELAGAALLECRLDTGRRHQIRVQAWLHGHPLVGERLYRDAESRPTVAFGRQALHAGALSFAHPVDGRRLEFHAPVPDDMTELVERLGR